MIIIVVIDKLLAFTGPFPIKLSEKLFSSGALRLLSADAGAGSCSWHWVVMIPEKRSGFFFNLFLFKCIFIVDFAFSEQRLKKVTLIFHHPAGDGHGTSLCFRCSLWMRSSCLPTPFSQEHFCLPGIPKCPDLASVCFSSGWRLVLVV